MEFATTASLYKGQVEAQAAPKEGMWEVPEQLLWSLPCPGRGKKSCPCSLLCSCVLSNAVECYEGFCSLRFGFKSLIENLMGNEPWEGSE